jgi:hypothetical protein
MENRIAELKTALAFANEAETVRILAAIEILEKESKIEQLALEMLNESLEAMKTKVRRAIASGVLDIENWNEKVSPMILPKAIVTACLESETYQFAGKGTSFEKQIKKDVKKLQYYI